MIVSALVLFSGWHILKGTVNVLIESKPENINTEDLVYALNSIQGVEGIHDLYIWMITHEFLSLTVHLRVRKDSDRDFILEKAIEQIISITGIHHITIQIEGRDLNFCENSCSV